MSIILIKFKNDIEFILHAKKHATSLTIQEIIIDILHAIEDVTDFCKPSQLAKKQSYKNGIRKV